MCMLPLLIAFHLDSISGDNCSVHYQLLSSVTLFHFLCQLCEQHSLQRDRLSFAQIVATTLQNGDELLFIILGT